MDYLATSLDASVPQLSEKVGGTVRRSLLLTAVLFVTLPSYCWNHQVPDIPTGSNFYLENKGTSDDSAMFNELLREELQKDSSSKKYLQPRFPVVDKKEEADYILLFVVVRPVNENHAEIKMWLIDPKGSTLWEGGHSRVLYLQHYSCLPVLNSLHGISKVPKSTQKINAAVRSGGRQNNRIHLSAGRSPTLPRGDKILKRVSI